MTETPQTTPAPWTQKLYEFWRRNNILLFQLPMMLLFLIGSYVILKGIDSRIGVEGFGDLFGYALNGVRVTLIIFTAWWMKRWCWFDLHEKTELELFQVMTGKESDTFEARMAYWIVVRDRAEWIAALAFATIWYTR